MKAISTFFMLAICSISSSLSAQPVLTNNEFYYIGDVITMANCSVDSAGPSGAGVTWDFSTLTTSGIISTTTVIHNSSPAFATASVILAMPEGKQEYVQENSTDSYIDGIIDTITHDTVSYNHWDESKRPFRYDTSYIDTYRVADVTANMFGSGYLTVTGDAYGTLTLPTGTYTNVLRIKKIQTEIDSVDGNPANVINTISYLWFDTAHAAPLFRIDSVTSLSASSYTAMYLTPPTAVKDVTQTHNTYTGCINNNILLLTGSFDNAAGYTVSLFNMTGTKVFGSDFIAYSTSQQFNLNNDLAPGLYVVHVIAKNDPSNSGVIKVVKQ